ncbi:MAG: hypothetical protein D3905_06720 [Candidatus Electrothrix sp. AS4_5]|nr:hypothetical protein [Candidatus Electrothrix gigas]
MKPNKKIIKEHDASLDGTINEDGLAYLLHEEKLVVSKRQYFSDLSPESKSPSHEKTTDKTSTQEQVQDSSNKTSSRGHADSPDIPFNDESSQEKELALLCQKFADVIEEFKKEVLLTPKKNSHEETGAIIEENIAPEPSVEEDDLLLLALFDSNDNSLGEEIDSDWLTLAGEAEEFDAEAISSFHDVAIEGTIEDTDRALQAALEVGEIFDLDKRQVLIVASIFEKNGWGNCRVAIERELRQGASIEELQLASELKELWLEHYEFYSGQTSNYRILSWPTALRLANSFRGYPDVEEVEQLLTHLYCYWSRDRISRYISKTFNEYLIFYIAHVEHGEEFAFEWNIEYEMLHADIFFMPPSTEDIPVLSDYELERALRNVRRNDTWMNEGFCQ